jgi:hypothetical protein
MGIITSEHQLFEERIDPRDHKVAEYMLKIMGRDAVHVAERVGNKIKSGAVTSAKTLGEFARRYPRGYISEKDSKVTMCANMVAGLALATLDMISNAGAVPASTGLVEDLIIACSIIGRYFGYTFGAMYLPVATRETIGYVQKVHQQAVTAVHGSQITML